MISLHADNSLLVQDKNKALNLKQKSKQLGTNTIVIGDNNQNITINQQISLIDNSTHILKEIKTALADVNNHKKSITEKFHTLLQQNNTKHAKQLSQLNHQYQTIISKQQLSQTKIQELKSDINQLIENNEDAIKELKKQISHMKTDIATLMQAFHNGNLAALSFYSLHIDGLYSDETFYKGAGVGYERLFNSALFDKGLSLITNVTLLTGTEENIIKDEDKTLFLFDLGLKKPFSDVHNNYTSYGKGSLGYMAGDESSLFVKLGIGIEKYNKKNKIALDLNYLGLFEKEHTIITTHLLGNAQVRKEKKYQSAIGLTLSIAFSSF